MTYKELINFMLKNEIDDDAEIVLLFDGEEYDYELETTWDVNDKTMEQIPANNIVVLKVHC